MIRNILLGLVLTDYFAVLTAHPNNWNGVFTDGLYGGSLQVCVTAASNGDYYGQATISTLGYMRGTIDATTDTWTGVYYMMGRGPVKGTFTLNLTVGTPSTYSAAYVQDPGISITVGGTQTSTVTPSDVDCFRTDEDYLVGTADDFTFTGTGLGATGTEEVLLATASDFFGSYTYELDDGDMVDGYLEGELWESGQVSTHNWYEPGSDFGLEITVAKNANSYYQMWWWIDSISDFNASVIGDADYHEHTVYTVTSSAYDTAQDNYCLMLSSASEESACSTSVRYSDDDDDEVDAVSAAVLSFGVINFVSIIVLAVILVIRTNPSATSDGKKTAELSATQSSMH